ncbi:fused response regulator/phosphatase [Marinagarivorans cellulosilyticus]|uniref:Two-component system, HptB-dependent secretion and biofilm response regulator n=1 Tax=Marinagarivorans cellulosilyticus TaxID=2721545 RepID=A0AAN2BLF0_9GAMM|nr:fused response regulator/phosphatase [Marinagarivorans cellulosilyticus]BCD98955.1 two-component system, HptB-dependent secretion and biofilm response regulator [Marinagarivorans cellulosilyticus]
MGDKTDEVQEALVKILVAEDSAVDRMILESMLRKGGYHVIMAEDGLQAVEQFERHNPDLVFLDVLMPNLNGIEAARKIREMSGDVFTPIVFLTSLADAESLATCLEAGGDDFLSKPYNAVIIEAKIKAFYRMREMNQTMIRQRDQIELNNTHLMQEQEVAKQVFDKITYAGTLDLPIIKYYMSALAVFNGDVILADLSPTGSLLLLLGDFTGHGLPAAIGSMPLASIFHGMARKGFSIGDIIREVNGKLYHTLPVGLFCCATAVDLSFHKKRALIWSGGLPEGGIYRAESRQFDVIRSTNLPLGVLSNREFNHTPARYEMAEGDQLFLWSDGIIEARKPDGNMFGEERLNAILYAQSPVDTIFDTVLKSVQNHIGDSDGDDDVSIVSLEMPNDEVAEKVLKSAPKSRGSLADWAMTLKLNTSSLKTFDPLPLLLNVISEVPHLRQSSSVLYTVLSELFNNAVEHGVLGLSSKLKSSPEGFATYYKLRKEGLEQLQDGWVTIDFEHQLEVDGGLLTIRFTDSGKGFVKEDEVVKTEKGDLHPNYFGRGLQLIDSICERLTINVPGNRIEAVFRWSTED